MNEIDDKFIELLSTDLDGSTEVTYTAEYLRNNGQEIEDTPNAEISAYIGLLANEEYINDGLFTGDRESIERQVDSRLIQPHEIPRSQFDLSYEDESGPGSIIAGYRRDMIDGIQSIQRDRLLEWAQYLGETKDLPDSFKLFAWEELTNPYTVYMNHTSDDNADHAAFDLTPRRVLNPRGKDIGPCPPLNHDAIKKAYEQMAIAIEGYDDESPESYYSVPRFVDLYKDALAEVTQDSGADTSDALDQGEASPVQKYFERVANKFIEDGRISTLICGDYLEYFPEGSVDFAPVLEGWDAWAVDESEYIVGNTAFNPDTIDYTALLENVIKWGCGEAFYDNLEMFRERVEPEDIALAIARGVYGGGGFMEIVDTVIQSANTGSQAAIANKLKQAGFSHLVASRLEMFEEGIVDHRELVEELLLEDDSVIELMYNLDKFDPGAIDQKKIIEKALAGLDSDEGLDALFVNLDKFDPEIVEEHVPIETVVRHTSDWTLSENMSKVDPSLHELAYEKLVNSDSAIVLSRFVRNFELLESQTLTRERLAQDLARNYAADRNTRMRAAGIK